MSSPSEADQREVPRELNARPVRCSVCGATRVQPDGACTFLYCPGPLRDLEAEGRAELHAATQDQIERSRAETQPAPKED